jgi:hypothetical protein
MATQDFLAPELRELSARVKALEEKVDTGFQHVNGQMQGLHEQMKEDKRDILNAIQSLEGTQQIRERLARLEEAIRKPS